MFNYSSLRFVVSASLKSSSVLFSDSSSSQTLFINSILFILFFTVTVYQSQGAFDPKLYQQLVMADVPSITKIRTESVVSVYEALVGEKHSEYTKSAVESYIKKEKKQKKEKEMEKDKKGKKKEKIKSISSKSSNNPVGKDIDQLEEVGVIRNFDLYGMCTIDFIPLFYGKHIQCVHG